MTSIAIVVPARNAGPYFGANLVRFSDYFSPYRQTYDVSFVIVDDASSDDTLTFAEHFARYRNNVTVLHQEERQGVGRTLRMAFRRVWTDYTVVVDRRASCSAAIVMELVETLERTGADMAIASPYMRGANAPSGPLWRYAVGLIANRVLSFFARGRYVSFTCMLRACRTGFLKRLQFEGDGIDAMPELMFAAIRAGGRIIERPIVWPQRGLHS